MRCTMATALSAASAAPATSFSASSACASDAVVSQSVGNLTAAGLAVIDGDEKVALHDASAEQVDLVRAAIDFYARSPDKVRRLIVAQCNPGVTAFGDAFRLRND